jgi:SAM-dependent methyltransferase
VATRLHEASEILQEPPLLRRLGGKAFVLFLHALGLTDLIDTQCGLKAFRRDAIAPLFDNLAIDGFAFDVEVLARAGCLSMDVEEVPISWRHVEASRVRPVRDGGRMLVDVIRLKARHKRLAAEVGAEGELPTAMDDERFGVMAALEREHWWFAAKRALVRAEVGRLRPPAGAALDIGCGTGAMVNDLGEMSFEPVVGVDPSRVALAHARRTSHRNSLVASVAEHLPFADGSFACVTSLDVIEHLDDDESALAEYLRVVVPGGAIIVAVPAYQWAWSEHDAALGHRRRYTATRLRRVAERAGLTVDRCSYFHSWLVPPALLLRKTPLGRMVRGTQEEASFVGPRVNRLLGLVTAVERRVAGIRRLPLGLSILLVAQRPSRGVEALLTPAPASHSRSA